MLDKKVENRQLKNNQLGIGFRPELALMIERRPDLRFVEILAEDYRRPQDIPQALKNLRKRGVEVLVHSISLSLGEAAISLPRLKKQARHLNEIARYLDAPFVSDHICFVRSGNLESGHLLPLQRSESVLAILARNIEVAKAQLSVPLVLENIASTFEVPFCEMDEATFVRRVLEQNDCGLLLDLSNLFANSHNMGFSAGQYLSQLPLDRLCYVHLAGGTFKKGLYHDTHAHPLAVPSLQLLTELTRMTPVERIMLERDDSFPAEAELHAELDAICQAISVERPAEKETFHLPIEIQISRSSANPSTVGGVQEGLTKALLNLGPVPEGYDKEKIDDAAAALTRKRIRTMKRAHPNLENHLPAGREDLELALHRFCKAVPSAHPDGGYSDSLAFLKFIRSR